VRLAPAAQNRPKSGVRKMMETAWGRPDAVHLEVGEPGFNTPQHVLDAVRDAAAAGHTKYAPTPGLPALREALAAKVRRANGINAVPSQVLVTSGGANALFAVIGTVLGPDDSMLLPNPGWSNFTMMTRAFGARTIYYDLDASNGFLPNVEQLNGLADASTRAIVLNTPSNPLGSVIDRALAEELLAFAAARDLWVIADECYDGIDFSGRFFSIGSLEARPERVISIYSFSKVYAMTGWRVGYAVLPEPVVDPMLGLLQPSVMCSNTPAQYGALAAVTGPQGYLDEWRAFYRANRDFVLDAIRGSRFSAMRPDGGFYVWLDVSRFGMPCEDVAYRLLDEANVAMTPGTAFGSNGEGHLRLSLATTRDRLELGLSRMLAWRP
jgi:aspartate/methionine/tyrosine aminotransferase